MTRQLLYPDQIIDELRLASGTSYDFITLNNSNSHSNGDTYKFGGIFKDSSKGKEWVEDQLKIFTEYLNPFSFFTIHMDGAICSSTFRAGFYNGRYPTIIYWIKNQVTWDRLSTYFGNVKESGPRMHAVVPTQYEATDLKKPSDESAADWEKRMRLKKHEAMRNMFC